jgi:hypothetical protein
MPGFQEILSSAWRGQTMPSTLAPIHGQTDSIDLFTSVLTFDPHSAEQSRLEMLDYEGSESGATRAYKPPMSRGQYDHNPKMRGLKRPKHHDCYKWKWNNAC